MPLAAAVLFGLAQAHCEMRLEQHARRTMSSEQYQAWQAERAKERRHRELVRAIREAGERAGRYLP